MWAYAERELRFTFVDGRVFEGKFKGLCAMDGTLTDAAGQRRPVDYDKQLLSDFDRLDDEEESNQEEANDDDENEDEVKLQLRNNIHNST